MPPDNTQTDGDFHVKCRERIERIDKRLAYMFANAPETYHEIKAILYAE